MDACVPVTGEVEVRQFAGGPVTWRQFAGGRHAGVEHQGPHGTMIQAYRHVADGIRRSGAWALAAGPPVQIFRHVDRNPSRHRTEVYFPLVRR